jgi:hypothetical protein
MVLRPILEAPGVLKERPHAVLMLDVAPRTYCLNERQESAGSVELISIALGALHLDATH